MPYARHGTWHRCGSELCIWPRAAYGEASCITSIHFTSKAWQMRAGQTALNRCVCGGVALIFLGPWECLPPLPLIYPCFSFYHQLTVSADLSVLNILHFLVKPGPMFLLRGNLILGYISGRLLSIRTEAMYLSAGDDATVFLSTVFTSAVHIQEGCLQIRGCSDKTHKNDLKRNSLY